MRRQAVTLLVASLALLGGAANARSQPRSFNGSAAVRIKGWGSVKASKGAIGHPTASCTNASCPAVSLLLKRPHVVLTQKPYQGWKFVGWHGGCRSKTKPTCVLDASDAPRDIFGEHRVRAKATFIPVAPGLTYAHPLPLGTAANVAGGLVVRVNSANANVQLGAPPPAGAEYFDANLTVTNTGSHPDNLYGFNARASNNARYYTDDGNGCSVPGPQPLLDTYDPFYPGESRTGYVCWTIRSIDASSLELFFGSGTLNFPRTTWFALQSSG
jgi:hypothetical protein